MTRVRTWAPWTVIVAVAIVALAYAQSDPGKRLLTSMGLKPKADQYVAFSFTTVQALPYSVRSGDRETMSLTVDNTHRDKAVGYTIDVGLRDRTATGWGALREHQTLTLSVPAGSSRELRVTLPIRCSVPTKVPAADAVPTSRATFTLSPSKESITHTMYCLPPI